MKNRSILHRRIIVMHVLFDLFSVHSIGNNWDFDKHAAEKFGCEVHCFDPR